MLKMPLNMYYFEQVLDLYIEVMKNDAYYIYLFPNEEEREEKMRTFCSEPIKYLLQHCSNDTMGVFDSLKKCDDGKYKVGKLVAFILPFAYRVQSLDEESTFIQNLRKIFFGTNDFVHQQLIEYGPYISYILSVVEHPMYKNEKLGFELIKEEIESNPTWTYAIDTTNYEYISWFEENNFIIKQWNDEIRNHILAIRSKKEILQNEEA